MRRVPRCEHAGSLILGEHAEESTRETSQRGLPASFGAEELRVFCTTCGASHSVVHSQVDKGTPGAMAAVSGKGAFPFCVQDSQDSQTCANIPPELNKSYAGHVWGRSCAASTCFTCMCSGSLQGASRGVPGVPHRSGATDRTERRERRGRN